jgi:hypothetical protein
MATLEELVVSLVAETKDLRKGLDQATKATAKATESMEQSVKAFTEGSEKQLSFWEQAMATSLGVLGSQAVLAGIGLLKDALGAAFGVLKDGVKAAQEQEDALNKLNTALALSGQYSRQTSKEMQEFASQMQATSKFGDELVMENAALIQSLGGLEKEGLKTATQAAIDMASALGIDLKSAATLVGKAAAGEIGSFTRYGVVIEKGATQAETFANALGAINSKFGGSGAAQLKTFSGATTALNMVWGDFLELIGDGIIKNQVVLAVINEVKNVVGALSNSLQDNAMNWKALVGQGILLAIDTLAIAVLAADAVGRALDAAFHMAKAAALAFINPVVAGLDLLGVISDDLAQEFYNDWSETGVAIADAVTGDTALGGVVDKIAEIKGAAEEGFKVMKSGAEVAIEPINNVTASVAQLTAEQVKQNEALKSFASALAERGAAAQSQYEFEVALLESNLANKQIVEADYFEARMALLLENQTLEQEMLQAARDQNLITEQEFNDAKTALVRKQALESKKIADDQRKFEEETNKLRTQNLASTLSTISSLASSGSKELAAIGKAAAISTATIDGIAAVQKALASAPPPFNFALAAAVGAATAANVAKIAGVGLNKGGTLAGGGANVDRIPASLTPGETVVDRSTTDKLKAFLDSGGQAQNVMVEISLKDELIEFIETRIIERQAQGVSLLGAV